MVLTGFHRVSEDRVNNVLAVSRSGKLRSSTMYGSWSAAVGRCGRWHSHSARRIGGTSIMSRTATLRERAKELMEAL